jgi:hypothetical protein
MGPGVPDQGLIAIFPDILKDAGDIGMGFSGVGKPPTGDGLDPLFRGRGGVGKYFHDSLLFDLLV